MTETYFDVVFDGREGGRLVDVENQAGESVRFGTWVQRDDGYYALRICFPALSPNLKGQQSPIANGIPPRSRRHWFGCKPKITATYGATYDCARCGQHWVSHINDAGPYYWGRHGRTAA